MNLHVVVVAIVNVFLCFKMNLPVINTGLHVFISIKEITAL